MARPDSLHSYKIGTEHPRGYGVIIVNSFKNEEYERIGADVDVNNLSCLFIKLGLEIIVKRNLSASAIIELLTDVSRNNDLFDHSVLVVALSSHGTANGLLGAKTGAEQENNIVSHKEIISIFSSQACPCLVGKPKVFIFNACRSSEENTLQVVEASALQEKVFSDNQTRKEGKRGTVNSDILKIYSCLEGFVSLRSNKRGSLFISTLCECWNELGNVKSLADIVSIVNGELIDCSMSRTRLCGSDSESDDNWSQCCCCESTLTSELRLGAIWGNEDEGKEIIQTDATRRLPDSRNLRHNKSFKKKRKNKKEQSTSSEKDKQPLRSISRDEYAMHTQSPQIELEPVAGVKELDNSVQSGNELEIPVNAGKEVALPNPPEDSNEISQKPDLSSSSLPNPDPTELFLCGTAFDEVNTVYIADGINSRVWCCNVTRNEFPGYIYDPVFDSNQPYAVVADENFVIITCGTTLVSFDARTLVKVEQFEHKLANFSGIDIYQGKVYVASNYYTYSIYTGSYSLDMTELVLSTKGSELKHELYLSDLKVLLSSLILLFNNSTTPVCVFNKEGVFMSVILQSPEVQKYRFFTIDHFNETIVLGEENAGHIMIVDLKKLVWVKYLYPRLLGLQLGGISLLAPDLLFVTVNTNKDTAELSDQCLTLTL